MSKEIETKYDHNLTKEELEGYTPTEEEYLEKYNIDQDEAYEDIMDLYSKRKDKENEKKYFNKISKKRQEKIIDSWMSLLWDMPPDEKKALMKHIEYLEN